MIGVEYRGMYNIWKVFQILGKGRLQQVKVEEGFYCGFVQYLVLWDFLVEKLVVCWRVEVRYCFWSWEKKDFVGNG